MYVPKGKWFNFWTDEIITGGKEMWVDADIDSMPIFVKEGAIIPKYPLQQYVDEKTIDLITLEVYYKEGKEDSTLYDDAHDGYDYTKGRYSLRTFKMTGRPNELIIQQHKEGKHITDYKNFELKFHGLPFKIGKIQIDNENIPIKNLKVNGSESMIIEKNFTQLHLIGIKA
jgi:alpha-glucosidase